MSNPAETRKIVEAIRERHAQKRAAVVAELMKDSGGWPVREILGLAQGNWCDEREEVTQAEIAQAKLEQ
ncbi:MAG TPA: hypothetical protein PKW15_03915 [Alphaproteobacteria bacterium]|nr:hypothetical protein [Rhodospirillaceae bacterium]HRJ12373.1 hypothetical protein [Alphaproteobacteria bacterium]